MSAYLAASQILFYTRVALARTTLVAGPVCTAGNVLVAWDSALRWTAARIGKPGVGASE